MGLSHSTYYDAPSLPTDGAGAETPMTMRRRRAS